jgi:glycosyltransferase domain-containing protein
MHNSLHSYKLTIFILSKDKNLVLKKLLEHWKGSGFKIVVLHETKTPINMYSQDSSVLYLPSCDPVHERIRKMSALVETDYVLMSPDDEVFSISAINNSLRFLDQNPDFDTIGGQTVAVSKYANHYNYLSIYRSSLGYETTSEDSLSRMKESIEKNQGSMAIGAPYRIMRRALFTSYMEAINELSPLNCDYLVEVLAEVYQNIHGKVKIQDDIFWIRNWIIPSASDTNRNFYYFQWWESPIHSNERHVLARLICKQFNRLSPKDLDKILQMAYSSRKETEMLEYKRLSSQKKILIRFMSKLSCYALIQRINFLYKSSSIESLQMQLEKNQIRYDKKELVDLTNFVINLDKLT